jgi:apolipoprotein N-acyltransferase
MQASKINVEHMAETSPLGLWQLFSDVNKLPFALVFGCIMGLTSPGFDQWWVAWFGLAPFLVLIALCRSKREAILSGFCFGMGYHLVSLNWYLSLYPLHWLHVDNWLAIQAVGALWIVEAVHESLLVTGFAWLVYALPMRPGFFSHYQRPYFPQLLSIPTVWVFFQWLVGTSEPFLGIPTDQLAYSQWGQTGLIQIAKVAGPGFVEFLIVMVNAALAACFLELPKTGPRPVDRVDKISPRVGALLDMGIALALVALAVAWGNQELNDLETRLAQGSITFTARSLPKVPVAILQNNVSIEQERLNTKSAAEIAQLYDQLSGNLGVLMIMLPEGAINIAQGQSNSGRLLSLLKARASNEKKEVVVGCIESIHGNLINGARVVAPNNRDGGLYVKRRLMPFLEFMPWREFARDVPETIMNKIPGARETFLSMTDTQLLSSIWGKIGLSISQEVIYPRLIAQEVRHGASLLINISNTSWFHNSTLNRQMLAAAVFRAVENERFVVISANTGISAVIDPAGVLKSASFQGRRGTLIDTVQFLSDKTLFTKMWWL